MTCSTALSTSSTQQAASTKTMSPKTSNTSKESSTRSMETMNKISSFSFKPNKTWDSAGMSGLPSNMWLLDWAMSIRSIKDGPTWLWRILLLLNQRTMRWLLLERLEMVLMMMCLVLLMMLWTPMNLMEAAPAMTNLLLTSVTLWSSTTTDLGTLCVMRLVWLQLQLRLSMAFGEVSSQRTVITLYSLTCDDLQKQIITKLLINHSTF